MLYFKKELSHSYPQVIHKFVDNLWTLFLGLYNALVHKHMCENDL